MANEPTGVRRAINAAWDKLPETLLASVVALTVFGFGMWLDCRDVKRELGGVIHEQAQPRFCERLMACPDGTSGSKREIADLRNQIAGLREIVSERGQRMSNIEQTIRDLRNSR